MQAIGTTTITTSAIRTPSWGRFASISVVVIEPIVTQVLNLKDTFWSLVLPICVSSFYIIIMRTFFQTTVPDALIESGKIDGASQLSIQKSS